MRKIHDFNRDLSEALKWEEKVAGQFKDIIIAEAVKKATLEEQKDGIDIIIKLKEGTFDVKFRDSKYFPPQDLLIETVSVVEQNKPGWFYTSKADAVVYLWWNESRTNLKPVGYLLFIQDPWFREWFEKHRHLYPEKETTTKRDGKTWKTKFVIVPIKHFPKGSLRKIYVKPISVQNQLSINQFLA